MKQIASPKGRYWSPYVAGAAIGALETAAMLTAKRPLGITTAFENVTALAASKVAPSKLGFDRYLQAVEEKPKIGWEEGLVFGVLIGSFFATQSGNPLSVNRISSKSPKAASLSSFFGGALMMFGARMAKGCTSGHGISGTMQFAASSWIFNTVIFATGAVVSRLLKR